MFTCIYDSFYMQLGVDQPVWSASGLAEGAVSFYRGEGRREDAGDFHLVQIRADLQILLKPINKKSANYKNSHAEFIEVDKIAPAPSLYRAALSQFAADNCL